jgi:hypothetical protein
MVSVFGKVVVGYLGSRVTGPGEFLGVAGREGFDLYDVKTEAIHPLRRATLPVLIVGPQQGLDAVVDLVPLVVVCLDELDVNGQLCPFLRLLKLDLPRCQLLVTHREDHRRRAGQVEFTVPHLITRKGRFASLARLLHFNFIQKPYTHNNHSFNPKKQPPQGKSLADGTQNII